MAPNILGVSAAWLAQNLKINEAIVKGWIKQGVIETVKTGTGQTIIPSEAEGNEAEGLRVTVLLSFDVDLTEEKPEDQGGPCKIVKFDAMKVRR